MTADRALSSDRVPNAAELNELYKHLLQYAIFAPSEHNSQPWLFRICDDSLELIADRTRGLPVVDPHDRAMTISCGAALDHLVLAARNMGRDLSVDLCPDPGDDDLLARVRLDGYAVPSSAEKSMFAAIPERRTTRARFEPKALPKDVSTRCMDIAESSGVELTLVRDSSRRSEIAALVTHADRMQLSSLRFRRELASWVHALRDKSRDGMSQQGLSMPEVMSPHGTLVIRTFDAGKGIAAANREQICEGSPTFAVLSAPTDVVTDWLATGRALSRLLLTLTAAGATASFLNGPMEIRELRPRLRNIMHCRGVPQLLMRFGYGPKIEPTLRRDLSEFLIP